jgi:hypothetical protein
LIGVGLLLAASQLGRQLSPVGREVSSDLQGHTAVNVIGVAEAGDYRNPFFGYRLRYPTDWEDVTAEARKRAAERSSGGASEDLVLLALARAPAGNGDDGAGLMFLAEHLPKSEHVVSGADYLRRALVRLQHHAGPPKQVKEEPQAVIGGLVYDRLSLRRPFGDGEIRMTYWVALRRGYALIITGSYRSPEGLEVIEALLARTSEDPEK